MQIFCLDIRSDNVKYNKNCIVIFDTESRLLLYYYIRMTLFTIFKV